MRVHNHASGRWEVGTRIPGQAAVKDAAWAPPLAREQEIVALCGASQLSLWGLRGPATALEVGGPPTLNLSLFPPKKRKKKKGEERKKRRGPEQVG